LVRLWDATLALNLINQPTLFASARRVFTTQELCRDHWSVIMASWIAQWDRLAFSSTLEGISQEDPNRFGKIK
jgi:hypothetical protein